MSKQNKNQSVSVTYTPMVPSSGGTGGNGGSGAFEPKSLFKFTGLSINRDGELLALTECGKVFLVYGIHGDKPTWRKVTDFMRDGAQVKSI